MRFTITGIQAQAKKQVETFKTLRPVGFATLRRDEGNAYDPYAIEVVYGDTLLGYVPALKRGGEYVGSELQKAIIEDGIQTAKITGYGYLAGEEWNDEHRGRLGSVELEVGAIEDSCSPSGGDYMRVTDFIGYLNPYGKGDGLIKWAFSQGQTFEEYETALNGMSEAGTAMHAAIQADLAPSPIPWEEKGGQDANLPAGWARFREKYNLDTVRMEERFYDSTLMVTGQPDWFGYCNGVLMVLDWKSGKKPSLKHLLQLSIYAKSCQYDGKNAEAAMVVCFGSDNKQGFATRTYKAEDIETCYEAMKHLRKVIDAVAYVPRAFEGVRRDS